MATGKDLKDLAEKWSQTSRLLIDAGVNDIAAFMLGHSLECALKSAICETLHMEKYPEEEGGQFGYFFVHNFSGLLRLAGLEYIFKLGTPEFRPWSEFTSKYSGNWVKMKYEVMNPEFTKEDVELLYGYLNGKTGEEGIFQILTRLRKW